MKLGHVHDLCQNGYAISSQFKTNARYGFQPVCLGNEVTKSAFCSYLNFMRPRAAAKNANGDPMTGPEDPLWLTWKGIGDISIGLRVSKYFRKTLGLSTNITTIRSLVETVMERKFRRGQISKEERIAVSDINGHSSQTVEDFYLLENTKANVLKAHQGFYKDDDDADDYYNYNERIQGDYDDNLDVENYVVDDDFQNDVSTVRRYQYRCVYFLI
jgi:hypothetical protein